MEYFLVFVLAIAVSAYVWHKLAKSNMEVPASAEQYVTDEEAENYIERLEPIRVN